MHFLNSVCTSSAKFQDNLFAENALPPKAIVALGKENVRTNGGIEAYIYKQLKCKYTQLENALDYCLNNDTANFQLEEFIESIEV